MSIQVRCQCTAPDRREYKESPVWPASYWCGVCGFPVIDTTGEQLTGRYRLCEQGKVIAEGKVDADNPRVYVKSGQTLDCELSGSPWKESDPDRYRRAAEGAGRDGIEIVWDEDLDVMVGVAQTSGDCPGDECVTLRVAIEADPSSPENWHDQAIQLVNRIHRLRELLRQAGEAI
jgi:hypothetical protein